MALKRTLKEQARGQAVEAGDATPQAEPLALKEVGTRRGIIRHNPRLAPVRPQGEADPGHYVAVQGIAIPNKQYDHEVARAGGTQQEQPCEHLHPRDIVNVPDGIDPAEAYAAVQAGTLRPATEADFARGPAIELQHAHVGLGGLG